MEFPICICIAKHTIPIIIKCINSHIVLFIIHFEVVVVDEVIPRIIRRIVLYL